MKKLKLKAGISTGLLVSHFASVLFDFVFRKRLVNKTDVKLLTK